jgi:hypothetical protein
MSVNSHGQTTFAIASASGQPTPYIAAATPSKGVGPAPSPRSTDDVSEIVRRVIEALHAQQLPELREDLLGSLLRDAGATKPDVRKAAKDLLIQQGSIASASVNAHGQKTFTVAQHVTCGVIPPKEAADPALPRAGTDGEATCCGTRGTLTSGRTCLVPSCRTRAQ